MASTRVRLLGGFGVLTGGRKVTADGFPTRRAAELVQLLALADGHRLLRDQVVEALWPHLDPDAGAANLRKAAHHARQALGDPEAVVLRGGVVALLPGAEVATDLADFERAAAAALAADDPPACAAAARSYAELLPDARYEEWAADRRERARARHLELLRAAGDWRGLLAADPADEEAGCAVIRSALARGDRHDALRAYGRLRSALERELGVRPGPAAEALYADCVAGLEATPTALVGRQVEQARLEAALASGCALVALRGPGGIGKSALAEALAERAEQQGRAVVRVRVRADSGPYAALAQAVEALLRRDRGLPAQLSDTGRAVLAALTATVPEAPAPAGPVTRQQVTRQQVIGALRRLLLAAGDGAGAVLVVDDAHLADPDTADALAHLAGAHGHVLVVLAYRPEAAGAALTAAVARVLRGGAAAVLDLAPLEPADAADLVRAAQPLAPDAVQRVVARGEGNPLLLLELGRAAHEGAGDSASLWEAVTSRLVDLDEGSRSMVQRLAITGDDLDAGRVLAVTGLSEQEGGVLLDAALAAGVLVVRGTRYAFRHDLVRQALAEQLPPHRRVAVHRDAARRLAGAGGTPDAVAAHWLAGGRPDEAVPHLVQAARWAAGLGAFAGALARLDQALAHAPGHPDALLLRAQSLEALGDARAAAAYAAAARVAAPEDHDDVLAQQALASVRGGDPAGGYAVLQPGLAPRTMTGRLARALALAGAAAMGHADPDLGVAQAAETRRLAVASGDPAAVVIASWAEAAAAHAKGDLPAVLQAGLRETYALPEVALTVFDGQLCVAERLLYGNRPYDEVIAFADALEAEADRLGAARGRAFATTFRGEARLLTGDLVAAQADLSRGAALHRSIGALGGEALSLQRLAEVAALRGDPDRAAALLDQALAAARDSQLGFHLYDRIYGSRIDLAGDPMAALAAVDEAEAAVQGAWETCPGCRITLAVPAAIAAARGGDLERALAYEQTAEQLTQVLMRLPGWYAALDEVRGHRSRAEGDEAAAGRHFAAAAARFRSTGQPLDAVRCERERSGNAG